MREYYITSNNAQPYTKYSVKMKRRFWLDKTIWITTRYGEAYRLINNLRLIEESKWKCEEREK